MSFSMLCMSFWQQSSLVQVRLFSPKKADVQRLISV